MADATKFSICLRFDKITPVHVYFSVFSGMILEEYEHQNATRAKAGELCMRQEQVVPFIAKLCPDLLMRLDTVDEGIYNDIIHELNTTGKNREHFYIVH